MIITEKIFCKKCGQKLSEGVFDRILGSKYVELSDGYYCTECAKKIIIERRK